MANINEILQRAASLRDETALNSISPERAGGIMYDTLIALNELWLQQGSALVISKIYASVSAMEADTAPVSDLTGQPLRPGQIVVIASSDSDNGSVYRYNGTTSPSWTSVGKIGNLEPVDSLDSDSTSLPLAAHQGKVLDGKISQLGQEVDEINLTSDHGVDGDDALSFVDENDECIAQFKDGHIQTKNFNSADTMMPDNEDEDASSLAFVDEEQNAVVQFKDGHIKTKYFDSRDFGKQKSFADIGIDKLTVSGSSTKADGQIILAQGVANRAYLSNGFEGAHWEMFAKFVCTGGVSFVMGKDGSAYGAWLEIKLENGNSVYNFYNNGRNGQYSAVYSGTIDFNLSAGEEYTLRLFFNVTTTKILGFEIFGQYNEYFTHTFDNVTCNGYGNPFFYSDNTCTVKEFSLSNQNYYDIKNAKAAVWGHSYVEGDSLGSNRDKTFTNLFANAVGANRVFNFGLGGDTWNGVYNKMGNEMGIVSNIQYGLVCCGANDSNLSLADTKSRITNIVALLQKNNIIPIIFTIAPIDPSKNGNWYNQMFVDANAWIRQNFLYVDMEQVFLDVDATGTWDASNVKTSLYLSDLVHPNVDGHAAIFRRIQMDCPFLF